MDRPGHLALFLAYLLIGPTPSGAEKSERNGIHVGTGSGDRWDNAGKGRDTAISVRGIRLVVPGSHAEMKFCCTDEGNEGTYDAGRVELGVRAACGSIWNIGMV